MSYTPNLLLKNVVPVSADFDGSEQVDIRITDGVIAEIGTALEASEGRKAMTLKVLIYPEAGWICMYICASRALSTKKPLRRAVPLRPLAALPRLPVCPTLSRPLIR